MASRSAEQRRLQHDLATFGAGQSFVTDEDRPAVYTVRSGDTYWNISRNQYGTGKYYRALALYNSHRIPDPRRMQKGMKVLVPDRAILESRFASALPRRAGEAADKLPSGLFHENGEVVYRVGRGDTLGGIAQRHLGRASRWQEIVRLNPGRLTNPAALKTGMELRLPADASRVRIVSEAAERR
jgi:nucleoid-associated protein YgaU